MPAETAMAEMSRSPHPVQKPLTLQQEHIARSAVAPTPVECGGWAGEYQVTPREHSAHPTATNQAAQCNQHCASNTPAPPQRQHHG